MGKEVEAEAEEKTGGMDLTRGDDCWTQRGKTMMKEKQFHRIGTRQTHPSFSWVVVITECFAPRRKGKERKRQTNQPTHQPTNPSINQPTTRHKGCVSLLEVPSLRLPEEETILDGLVPRLVCGSTLEFLFPVAVCRLSCC